MASEPVKLSEIKMVETAPVPMAPKAGETKVKTVESVLSDPDRISVINAYKHPRNPFELQHAYYAKPRKIPFDEEWSLLDVTTLALNSFLFTGGKENKSKNLYSNIFPYAFNRVKLGPSGTTTPLYEGVDNDYINASHVSLHGRKYIVAQAPTTDSQADWWQMIWEQDVRLIVMATLSATKYYSHKAQSFTYGPKGKDTTLKIDLVAEREAEDKCSYSRTFKMTNAATKEEKTTTHLYLRFWPDQDVPESQVLSDQLTVYFHELQRITAEHKTKETSWKVLVHCSAGVGRASVFVLVASNVERARKAKAKMTEMLSVTPTAPMVMVPFVCDVFEDAVALREQRMFAIQTRWQYQFCYEFLGNYLPKIVFVKKLEAEVSKEKE